MHVYKYNILYEYIYFLIIFNRNIRINPNKNKLFILQVQNGTLAYNYLNVGDRVLEIDGIDCYSLTESQAISFLRRPSNTIELLILKRRGENVVPPKRSSSCKALKNFYFPKSQSISEPTSPSCQRVTDTDSERQLCAVFRDSKQSRRQCFKEPEKDFVPVPIKCHNDHSLEFSNFRPRRNSLQKDGEPICLRSRSSSPQFWKLNTETFVTGPSNDCKRFWKQLEKCSMEDLSARHTPSPIRPASVAFYPKTPESNIQPSTEEMSPKKKVIRLSKYKSIIIYYYCPFFYSTYFNIFK